MNISFIPSDVAYLKNNFFNANFSRDMVFEPFSVIKKELESHGHNVGTYDFLDKEIDIFIVTRIDIKLGILLKLIKKNPLSKVIYLVTEERVICPIHNRKNLNSKLFDLVLTWDDSLVDQRYFFKCNYPNPIRIFNDNIQSSEKKLITMINGYKKAKPGRKGELYTLRSEIAKCLSHYDGFDLYGVGWDQINKIKNSNCFKGVAKSKLDVLCQYKFSIAIENSSVELGGISEKIFDSFGAGCIPIYLGAPNVTRYIPKECFIDYRDFSSPIQLYRYISTMEESEYIKYISAIKSFMRSKEYEAFNTKGFTKAILESVNYVSKNAATKGRDLKAVRIEWLWKYFSGIHQLWSNYRIPLHSLGIK